MTANWDVIAKFIVGAIPVLVTLVGVTRGPSRLRSTLKHDVELLALLPEDSDARSHMLDLVEAQVKRIALLETEGRRNWQNFASSAFIVVVLSALGLWLFSLDRWWWTASAVFLLIFSLVGLSSMWEDVQRVPRDEKGKPR